LFHFFSPCHFVIFTSTPFFFQSEKNIFLLTGYYKEISLNLPRLHACDLANLTTLIGSIYVASAEKVTIIFRPSLQFVQAYNEKKVQFFPLLFLKGRKTLNLI